MSFEISRTKVCKSKYFNRGICVSNRCNICPVKSIAALDRREMMDISLRFCVLGRRHLDAAFLLCRRFNERHKTVNETNECSYSDR